MLSSQPPTSQLHQGQPARPMSTEATSSHIVWGEHEMDYILFIQADVDLDVNPTEAKAVKYVDLEEL